MVHVTGNLRPAFSGPAIVRDGKLTVQGPVGELAVRAPPAFLRALVKWCDGTRDAESVVQAAGPSPERFRQFVEAMLLSGVLVHQPCGAVRALMRPARARDCSLSPAADAPACCFAPQPVAQHQLTELLSCLDMAGLQRAWQSSGDPALRVSLVLRNAVGAFPAGLHDLRCEPGGPWLLDHRGPVGSELYRAFDDPAAFARAAGLVLVSCELEGSSSSGAASAHAPARAVLNAGVVRHFARQGAQRAGLAWADELSFSEATLHQHCGLGTRTLIHVGAFGAPGDGGHKATLAYAVRWVDDPTYRGLFLAQASAKVKAGAGQDIVAWGRAYDAKLALDKAVGELAERMASRAAARVVRAKVSELPRHVDPCRLVRYSARQHAAAALNVRPFDAQQPHWWVEGREWPSGESTWLPAECVLPRATLPVEPDAPGLGKLTTSGCAADVAREAAVERAAYEIIERDALARHWLAQAPATLIDTASLPVRIQRRVQEMEAVGCATFVLGTTHGLGPAILVLIQNARRGFTCAGAACGSDAATAVEHAFIEAEFAAIARGQGVAASTMAPRRVASPKDHAGLYARPAYFRRADVLIGTAARATRLEKISWPGSLRERLGKRPMYSVDLASDVQLPDLEGRRIHAVRVLIPDCIPLAFGYDALPQGMVSHPVSMRGRFPHPLA